MPVRYVFVQQNVHVFISLKVDMQIDIYIIYASCLANYCSGLSGANLTSEGPKVIFL